MVETKAEDITEMTADSADIKVEVEGVVEAAVEMKDAEKEEVSISDKDKEIESKKEMEKVIEKDEIEKKVEGKDDEKTDGAVVVEMSTVESETTIKSDESPAITIDKIADTAEVTATAPAEPVAAAAAPASAPAVVTVSAPKSVSVPAPVPVLPMRVKPSSPSVLLCSMVNPLL
jgi:hypothetical protein